ncbi:MAG: hypothetical protein AAF629_10515 [Chloroflexota bacterium]
MMEKIIGKLFRMAMIDRQAKNKDVAELRQQLVENKKMLTDKLAVATDSEENRQQIRHVIGIERWAQSRLKVVLGEPFKQEEHDGYLPANNKPVANLAQVFDETRQETLTIAQQLAEVSSVETQVVNHNAMGAMTVRSWLQYIDTHGTYELRKL